MAVHEQDSTQRQVIDCPNNLKGKQNLYGDQVRVLGQGDTFGDIALTQSVGRTATIICGSECFLFELTIQDYKEALMMVVQKEKIDKISTILQSFPEIETCTESIHFDKIIYSIKEISFNLGDTILQKGQ